MILKTKFFGEIEIEEHHILNFEHGLPGFENYRKFVLIDSGEEGSPFKYLQSFDEQRLAFVLVDPFAIKKDYEIELDDEVLKELKINDHSQVEVYSIVVVPEDINKMTMNLQAPVIINRSANCGKQVILDTDRYGVRHYVLEELHRGREETKNAGADSKKRAVNYNR